MTSTRPGMKKALAAVEGSVPSATSTAAASANSAAFSAAVAASSPCSASSPSMPPSCSEARVRPAASPPPEVVTVWTEVPSAWTTVVVVVNLLMASSRGVYGAAGDPQCGGGAYAMAKQNGLVHSFSLVL